jgi:hypothetical protein
MRITDGVAYMDATDREAIRAYLKSVAPDRRIVVEVYPWGDGLLIEPDDPRIRIQVPYFDAVFYPPDRWAWGYKPTEYGVADVYLVRVSRYTPRGLKHRDQQVLDRALRLSGVDHASVIRTREDTETWYAVRPKDRAD